MARLSPLPSRLACLSSLLSAAFLVPTAAPATAVREPPFTLEQVLSSPFPSPPVAAPVGSAVVWVMNDRGRRNLWVTEGQESDARRLTAFDEDDGQELGSLAFSPDGRAIAFVRGGAPNPQGELPNPTSDPGGVEREVFVVGLDGTPARKIGAGSSPVFSADGSELYFLDKGKVWSAALHGNEDGNGDDAAQPEELLSARGSFSDLRLSPDGSHLAFTSQRGTHSFVGVFDLERRRIIWLDPAVDRDGSPVFSPDGRHVAFLRLPARQTRLLFGPRREGEPWSIRVAEVGSGTGKEVFRADPGPGSVFREVVADDQLRWTNDGLLVFPWEKTGWTHLWAVPASGGGQARDLTPGHHEVEWTALTADGQGLVYSSNLADIDRRHLWRVAAAGGEPQRLTRGSGIEQAPAPMSDGKRVALLRSGARRPITPAILDLASGDVNDLASPPSSFPAADLVEPQAVVFSGADGLEIHAQLFLPPASSDDGEKRHPALVFLHGGSRRQMLLGFHYSSYYHNCYAFNQYMASRGFVVLAVNYRSGIGYGMEFREAVDYGATGASELNDVLGAGLYLRARDDVDGSRIALWGGSYGGYLTALGLARASDLFAAGVDLHGVHDWNKTIANFWPAYDPQGDPDAARLAFESSPLATVDRWRSPVLLIHGDDDRNVPFRETVDLVEELRRRGVEHELLIFPDEVHGFLRHDHWLEVFRRAADFLERKVGRRSVTGATVPATTSH